MRISIVYFCIRYCIDIFADHCRNIHYTFRYPLYIPISITVFIYMLTTIEISIIYSGIHHCIDIYADHCRNIHYIFRYPRQLIYMLTTVELSIIYFGIHHCIYIYADHCLRKFVSKILLEFCLTLNKRN